MDEWQIKSILRKIIAALPHIKLVKNGHQQTVHLQEDTLHICLTISRYAIDVEVVDNTTKNQLLHLRYGRLTNQLIYGKNYINLVEPYLIQIISSCDNLWPTTCKGWDNN